MTAIERQRGFGRWIAATAALAMGCGPSTSFWRSSADTCTPVAGPEIQRQGELYNTGNAMDLALFGPGFFVVAASAEPGAPRLYTRDGRFALDRDGYLVNLWSMRVLGMPADLAGVLSTTPSTLHVGQAVSLPLATGVVWVRANLQSDAAVLAANFDLDAPAATSNFSFSTTVYDSLGKAYQVDVYLKKFAAGAWNFHALTDGSSVTGGTPGSAVEIGNGYLAFDTAGRLVEATQASSFYPAEAKGPQLLYFSFGWPVSLGDTGVDGVTQFASPSTLSYVNQDGQGAGSLASLRVDSSGEVVGVFSNGHERTLALIAVARFPAPVWLEAHADYLFTATASSGAPDLGAGGDGRGDVVRGALEVLADTTTCLPPAP